MPKQRPHHRQALVELTLAYSARLRCGKNGQSCDASDLVEFSYLDEKYGVHRTTESVGSSGEE
jgi:hypothetical protein